MKKPKKQNCEHRRCWNCRKIMTAALRLMTPFCSWKCENEYNHDR